MVHFFDQPAQRSDNAWASISRALLRQLQGMGIDTALNDSGKPWQNIVNDSFRVQWSGDS